MRRVFRNVSLGVVAAGFLAAGLGCGMLGGGGQQIPLASAQQVPAAKGKVDTKVNDDGNTQFKVQVEHLAPADQVVQGASNYVVWIRPLEGDQTPQNAGILGVDRDQLTGSFSGITPHRRFQLSITAEQSPTVSEPSGNQVLSAQVFQYNRDRPR